MLALLLGATGVASTTLSTALNFGPDTCLRLGDAEDAFGAAGGTCRRDGAGPPAAPGGCRRCGLIALTALVVLVAQAPADPYFAQSLQAWEQGRFIRFHGAAQWVGWLWPYAAIAYLLAMSSLRPERRTAPPSA